MEIFDLIEQTEQTVGWGGKRRESGRPTIREKRRILAIRKVISKWEEMVKPYEEKSVKQQGAYSMAIKFLNELREADGKVLAKFVSRGDKFKR